MSFKWAEISDAPARERFDQLSAALSEAGFDNEVAYIECGPGEFAEAFQKAQADFAQLRVGDTFGHQAVLSEERMPSNMRELRAADCYVQTAADGRAICFDGEGVPTTWWPRNYLRNGLQRVIVGGGKNLDTSGAVLVLGTGTEARTAVFAMVRAGFSRFSICDPDEQKAMNLITDFERHYFNVSFQIVARDMVTQLPSTHTVAINALALRRNERSIDDLYFFNFLKPGGLWLDLAFVRHADLANEATAVGARVEIGARVAAWTDCEWARQVLGVSLDDRALIQRYESAARAG